MLAANEAAVARLRGHAYRGAFLVSLVGLLLLGQTPGFAHLPQLNVSAYEIFLGAPCIIGGQPATCGVAFFGWLGGDGNVAGGWEPFPGTGDGLWQARIDYTGAPGFGNVVNILGGRWRFVFVDRHFLAGHVTGGTVEWPNGPALDLGCGNGVGVVDINLLMTGGGTASFDGCLHDLPAGTVIPPLLWGMLSTP